jgi:RNA polymerase sigma factor (sigma-70 family)
MPVRVSRHLWVIASDDGATDAELLGRFIDRRDEAAFALLVRRHAAMVYGVCRRILPTAQDAEDAFQATFLVLVEKAQTAVPREAVGNWLYGVARRAALLARRTIVRRGERAAEMGAYPAPEPLDELRLALDEELSRLPDVYRTVIVLCDLEGLTRREAAALLGWPEGTVAGRLARARALLARRLARHAPTVSVAAVLAGTASARVPEVFPPTAPIPPGVAALTREVMGAMARGKLMKTATVVLLALGCAGFGMYLQAGPEQTSAPTSAPVLVERENREEQPVKPVAADEVVWGKEVDGLQAGLILKDGRTYVPGETINLVVKLRNVTKAEITITHSLLRESPPRITDAKGAGVSVTMPPYLGIYVLPTERVLKPGATITLYAPNVAVAALPLGQIGPEPLVSTPTIRVRPGKYKIAFGGMVHSHPKLVTGDVEFEVKDAPPAAVPPVKAPAGARERFSSFLSKAGTPRCAFLDNDRILIQSSTADALEVRDAKTGKVLKSVRLDKQFVGDFRLSADRKWVAAVTTADTTGTFVIPQPDVTVWETATWKVCGAIRGRRLLDLAADGRTVLVREDDGWGGAKGRIEVWDVVEHKMLKAAPFAFGRLDAAAIAPDGSLVAVSGTNEIAYWKWREDTGDKYDRLKVGRKVDALVFSPDGKFVAEGPDSRMTVEVRDGATLKVAQELSDQAQPRIPQMVAGMVFADSGKTLVFGNRVSLIESIPVPHRIHFWDLKSGKLTRQIDLKGGVPSSLDVSPDGKTLAAVTSDGGVSLRVFDLDPTNGPAPRK